MEKKVLNENEQKIINEAKNMAFKQQLIEGFQNGHFMTSDVFCQRLEKLKASSMEKHKMRYGNNKRYYT